mmetsp:Transcript_2451/g.5100  ORF Transcript_2451/g.5100 Transcript_2451/m.5100 type:complete len:176 (+) Transcript_2451:1167-1694(+)
MRLRMSVAGQGKRLVMERSTAHSESGGKSHQEVYKTGGAERMKAKQTVEVAGATGTHVMHMPHLAIMTTSLQEEEIAITTIIMTTTTLHEGEGPLLKGEIEMIGGETEEMAIVGVVVTKARHAEGIHTRREMRGGMMAKAGEEAQAGIGSRGMTGMAGTGEEIGEADGREWSGCK